MIDDQWLYNQRIANLQSSLLAASLPVCPSAALGPIPLPSHSLHVMVLAKQPAPPVTPVMHTCHAFVHLRRPARRPAIPKVVFDLVDNTRPVAGASKDVSADVLCLALHETGVYRVKLQRIAGADCVVRAFEEAA
ncbi:hypothetical protein D9615_009833 [Tricholomella constricta]|uniref:Uncharacterized protein n=1 Tax=Tricholomella constricta TaxID=117010 RepID=A0A8H5LX03_9AGAR|nr:hypothetical protein D9615_009833 [Tricholomella constricta]